MEDQLYDELLVELECPICTNYMSPPIRQCATGHSICESCRKKLQKCALCEGKFTDSRNISLEGLAVKMRYPCVNKPSGCAVRLSFNERENHELHCPLKGFRCAMDKCLWVGKVEDLGAHWASKKISSKPYRKSNICHTKMKAESYYVNMVEAYNELFWFKCKLTNNKIYWAVQYIGNARDSDAYSYEIEIFKPGRAKKKILMSDYCQPIDMENYQLFNDDFCISINADSINSFVSADQILIYYLRVNAHTGWHEEGRMGAAKEFDKKNTSRPRDRSKGPPHQGHASQKKKVYISQYHQNKAKSDDFGQA